MIVLTSGIDTLRVTLSEMPTTYDMPCVVSFRSINNVDEYVADTQVTVTSGTGIVPIVDASPNAASQRVIDYICLYNQDTKTSYPTISYYRNSTPYTLWSGELLAGEGLHYVEGAGWQKQDILGGSKAQRGSDGSPGVSGVGIAGTSGISFIWRNIWDVATNYIPNDVVFFSGSSYINRSAATGIEPPSAEWDMMSQKGDEGQSIQGEPGVSGVGIQGEPGAPGIYPASLHTTVSGICYAVLNDNKSNFDFPGRTTASFVILRPTAGHGITGILSTDIPVGWVMFIHNNSTYTPSLNHDSGGSDAANRFYLPGATGIVMGAYATVPLIRTCLDADGAGTTIRWVALAW
jgi:hypothetical protein